MGPKVLKSMLFEVISSWLHDLIGLAFKPVDAKIIKRCELGDHGQMSISDPHRHSFQPIDEVHGRKTAK